MAGRVGAPEEVRERLMRAPYSPTLPPRIQLPVFLKLASDLPWMNWAADLAPTEAFLDFSTTVPLYSLVNFEMLLRPPDERRHVRMSADFAVQKVQRSARQKEANDALRDARVRASSAALGGEQPPSKPIGGTPRALWQFAATRALTDRFPSANAGHNRRRSSGIKRPQSAPSTIRAREFGPGKRREIPRPPPSASEASSAHDKFSQFYNEFESRLDRSALPNMSPAERAASQLDSYLSVQGIDLEGEQLVTVDDLRENETIAEDLRWEIMAATHIPTPPTVDPARKRRPAWQRRSFSATAGQRRRSSPGGRDIRGSPSERRPSSTTPTPRRMSTPSVRTSGSKNQTVAVDVPTPLPIAAVGAILVTPHAEAGGDGSKSKPFAAAVKSVAETPGSTHLPRARAIDSGDESDPPTPEPPRRALSRSQSAGPALQRSKSTEVLEKISRQRSRASVVRASPADNEREAQVFTVSTHTTGPDAAPLSIVPPEAAGARPNAKTFKATAADWDVLFPQSAAALKTQNELDALKAEVLIHSQSTGVVKRDWRQQGSWMDAL